MNANTDVASIVAAAMTPELAELERQLDETLRAMNTTSRELPALRDRTNRTLNMGRAIGRLTDEQMAADDVRIAEIEATVAALNKVANDITRKIAEIKPAYVAAVVEGLAPVRARAANDIQFAVRTLYAACATYNKAAEALKMAGAVNRPLVFPARIRELDAFVQKMSEDRI